MTSPVKAMPVLTPPSQRRCATADGRVLSEGAEG